MLTHPKPEEPELAPTPAQRDATQDGTGKLLHYKHYLKLPSGGVR